MSIKEKALQLWGEKIKHGEHIVSSLELPDQRQRQFLVKEKYLARIARGYWLLKHPADALEEIFPLLYWQTVEALLSRYENWSIRSKSAFLLLCGDQSAQQHLLIRTKEKTNRKLSLPLGFDILLTYDAGFDNRLVEKVQVADRNIPVDIPEKVLIDNSKAPMSELRNFVAGTQFDLRVLEALYAKNPKPLVFTRLAGIAKDAERLDLAITLNRIIDTYTHYQVGKRETEIIKAPVNQQVITKSPWVLRQEQQFEQFEQVLEGQLAEEIGKLEAHPLDMLLSKAKDHKKYDTYHSTTLEGYRITPEEVDALLSGIVPPESQSEGEDYFKKLKNRMAILGYSAAFDFIIDKIQQDFGNAQLTEQLIKDTYYYLFKPSADAGITDYITLARYRDAPAFIRGTKYVPPAYAKLSELMLSFEVLVSHVRNPVKRAILAHYFFVTIHPYLDGNGRTSRLLMNYLLLATGHPWITIRAEQRVKYFEALKKGQLENDIMPFGKFIVDMLKEASDSLT